MSEFCVKLWWKGYAMFIVHGKDHAGRIASARAEDVTEVIELDGDKLLVFHDDQRMQKFYTTRFALSRDGFNVVNGRLNYNGSPTATRR